MKPCQYVFGSRMCWETGPSGWEPTNREKETEPDGFGRNLTESDVNLKQGHICKYVPMALLRLESYICINITRSSIVSVLLSCLQSVYIQ